METLHGSPLNIAHTCLVLGGVRDERPCVKDTVLSVVCAPPPQKPRTTRPGNLVDAVLNRIRQSRYSHGATGLHVSVSPLHLVLPPHRVSFVVPQMMMMMTTVMTMKARSDKRSGYFLLVLGLQIILLIGPKRRRLQGKSSKQEDSGAPMGRGEPDTEKATCADSGLSDRDGSDNASDWKQVSPSSERQWTDTRGGQEVRPPLMTAFTCMYLG